MLALAVAVDTLRTRARHPEWREAVVDRLWSEFMDLPVVDVEVEPIPDLPPLEWPEEPMPSLLWHDGELIWR